MRARGLCEVVMTVCPAGPNHTSPDVCSSRYNPSPCFPAVEWKVRMRIQFDKFVTESIESVKIWFSPHQHLSKYTAIIVVVNLKIDYGTINSFVLRIELYVFDIHWCIVHIIINMIHLLTYIFHDARYEYIGEPMYVIHQWMWNTYNAILVFTFYPQTVDSKIETKYPINHA